MSAKSIEWRPGPTVCRCCLTEGCYKDISTEYFWMGKREVYGEMLLDTFNVTIAYSQSGGPNSNSRLICEPCISRLRDANDFRRQVLECEKTFMQHLDPGSSSVADLEVPVENLEESVKLEQIKLEKRLSDDEFDERDYDDDDDDDDDMDDEPLTKLASKIPKKEVVDLMDLLDNTKAAEKRKSSTKVKAAPSKKSKIVKKEPVKASASKVAPKPEKKKKELDPHRMAKRNAELVLQYSTVYPFRLRGRVLFCVYCSEGYEVPAHFRRHVDCIHKKFSVSAAFAHVAKGKDYLKVDCANLACRFCGEPFSNVKDTAVHLSEEHGLKVNLDYDIALQCYKLEKDKWFCFLCDAKLPNITKLCRHTVTAHYQKCTCDICGKTYMTIEGLRYHIRCSHSGKFPCRKCWKEFSTTEERIEHQKRSKRCWNFGCIYCGERFQSWEVKNKHLVEKHDCPEVKYPCSECDSVFLSRKRFNNHYRKMHTDEAFVCLFCRKSFTTRIQLKEHRNIHAGIEGHKCPVCAKTFPKKFTLNQHMWIHSEVKRFECIPCNKRFNQKVGYKKHMEGHHAIVID